MFASVMLYAWVNLQVNVTYDSTACGSTEGVLFYVSRGKINQKNLI